MPLFEGMRNLTDDSWRGYIEGLSQNGGIEVFVWVFHRISGIVLIFLIGFQLFTGFFQASTASSEAVKVTAGLHKHVLLNCLMVFLFVFHALYGVRTILLDLGIGREKLLFWACTLLGLALSAAFLVLFLTLVRT